MRLYALVEAGDPKAIDVYLCEQDAQHALDSVWERRSVGARSLCALATLTSALARWRTAPASTTNLVTG
jgi:hypothetical protein